MNEYLLRQRLMQQHDMSWDEAQEEISNRASDAYDQEQDRRSEERYAHEEQRSV